MDVRIALYPSSFAFQTLLWFPRLIWVGDNLQTLTWVGDNLQTMSEHLKKAWISVWKSRPGYGRVGSQ
jgi:hypothetical protein